MKVISVVASKGGVGKTCVTAGLAVAAAEANPGARIGIVDADPQGSLTAWWNWRGLETPSLYPTGRLALIEAVEALGRQGLDFLIIDTPPGLSPWQREAVGAADLVLVPCQPSAIDLAAIETTESFIAEADATSALVLNRAVFRTRLAGEAVTNIRESGRLLLPVLHQRVDVPAAMALGQTPIEMNGGGAAAAEQRALWWGVKALLHRSARPARAPRPGRHS